MVIAGERRCVGVTRRVCEYASRQCKIVYGPCWRNRHRSAPARSGYGHHVKCGSCDMPLRSAKVGRVSTGRSGGLGASGTGMVRLCVEERSVCCGRGRRGGARAKAACCLLLAWVLGRRQTRGRGRAGWARAGPPLACILLLLPLVARSIERVQAVSRACLIKTACHAV